MSSNEGKIIDLCSPPSERKKLNAFSAFSAGPGLYGTAEGGTVNQENQEIDLCSPSPAKPHIPSKKKSVLLDISPNKKNGKMKQQMN